MYRCPESFRAFTANANDVADLARVLYFTKIVRELRFPNGNVVRVLPGQRFEFWDGSVRPLTVQDAAMFAMDACGAKGWKAAAAKLAKLAA